MSSRRIRELTEPLRLRFDGFVLYIPDAALSMNRYNNGIRELFRRIKLEKNTTMRWSRFRELAVHYHVLVDPRDDPQDAAADEEARGRGSYRGPGESIVGRLRGAGGER
jgi:hypothetical protein